MRIRAPALSVVADELAVAVHDQWEREAKVRRLNDPYPIAVRWLPTDPPLCEDWDGLTALAETGAGWPRPAGTWAARPAELAGSGNMLAAVLGRVPTGRLVVLGEPGSGKTMLMVRLVLDLLQRRSPGELVPVLVPVASWNPLAQEFGSWLASQLLIAHPALNAAAPGGAGTSRAEALVQAQLIMPILDGLDELPDAVRGRAIAAISQQLRPGERLVLTSRTAEYRAAAHPDAGPEITLAAAAIQLQPLGMPDVIAYLQHAAGGPRSASRWNPVFEALTLPGALAEVLSTPLMVGLARAIYNPRPDEVTGTLPDPAELCTLGSTQAIEGHLLDAFVPAAYRPGRAPPRARREWNARQAEKWLAFLARYLEHVTSEPGFAWWELRMASPALTAAASGAMAGVAVGIPLTLIPVLIAVVSYVSAGHWQPLPGGYAEHLSVFHFHWERIARITLSWGAAMSFAGLLTVIGSRKPGQHLHQAVRWNDRNSGLRRILLGLLYAMAYSLIISAAIDHTFGLPSPLTLTGAATIAMVLATGLAAGLAASGQAFRMGTVAAITIGAMTGTPFLFHNYSSAVYAVGLPFGLAAGAVVMARGPGRHPSRSIRWRPRNGIISGSAAGAVMAILDAISTQKIPIALIFGLMVGLGTMVLVGLERVPGDLAIAVSPIGVLKRDRAATLTFSCAVALAAGLVVGIGTLLISNKYFLLSGINLLTAVVLGLSIGPAVGLVFGLVLSGYGSAWPQWVIARETLAIRRQVPRRLMAFLSDAHERGVLRQAGPLYQFRHIELQRRLASRTAAGTSPEAPENRPPEPRHDRARFLPRPPASRHPIPVKIFFWLVSLAVAGLCSSVLTASIAPTPGDKGSPAGVILAGLGIMFSAWLGLYAYQIPFGTVRDTARWLAVARYVAPWPPRREPSASGDDLTEPGEPGSSPGRNALPGSANRSAFARPVLLTVLAAAASVTLLTIVLHALTNLPRPAATLPDPHSYGVNSAAFSPDGTTLATADNNGTTYLWNPATRKITATLTDPHSDGVLSVAFTPDGTTLATTDGNGSTYLASVTTRKITATLPDPNSARVDYTVFNPDGTLLVTADRNGSTYLWNLG